MGKGEGGGGEGVVKEVAKAAGRVVGGAVVMAQQRSLAVTGAAGVGSWGLAMFGLLGDLGRRAGTTRGWPTHNA